MNKDFICKCGHILENHADGNGICFICFFVDKSTWDHIFEPDNLKYLEEKFKENYNG